MVELGRFELPSKMVTARFSTCLVPRKISSPGFRETPAPVTSPIYFANEPKAATRFAILLAGGPSNPQAGRKDPATYS